MRKMYLLLIVALLAFSCENKPQPEPEKPSIPAVPTGLSLHGTPSETSLTFQWTAVSGATSYSWQLTKVGSIEKEGTVSSRNVAVNGLTKATDYRFGVKAVNDAGESDFAWVDARTAGEDTPVPPPSKIAYEDFAIPSAEEDGVARAFPGAEGGGMYVTGGRGGKIIHVTNLNDKGAGSLRAAIEEKGARIIVFDVAGIIELQSALVLRNGDVTIAGQTAPGDGICLKNYNFRIHASNVIVRFIRCRMGDEKKTEDDAMNIYTGDNNLSDIIIDHCSLSWSTDECGSFYGMTNFSLQWCILSESLRNSVHGKGKHGYGGIWGGSNATYHHNLLAHHDSRNPRLDHDYVSTLKGPVSLVNNVIYNWGGNSAYGGESVPGSDYKKYNIINNYYKPGPSTVSSGKIRFLDPTTSCSNCSSTNPGGVVPGHFFMDGNVMDYNSDAAGDMSTDNWKGTTASASVIAGIKADARFSYPENPSSISLHSAGKAYAAVLDYSGACLSRDKVDARIAKETRERTFTYTGSNGSRDGLIDSQTDVEGWPEYKGDTRKDSDGDGIPDAVEDDWGLDKDEASDGAAVSLDKNGRYTNLEMYLHYLVREIVSAQNKNATYTNF